MDHRSLVVLFRRIILAGPLAAALNFGCGSNCNASHVDQTVPISQTNGASTAGESDAGIDDLIARCQASSSDCAPLCRHALPQYAGPYESCGLVTVDGGLAVHAVYTTICG